MAAIRIHDCQWDAEAMRPTSPVTAIAVCRAAWGDEKPGLLLGQRRPRRPELFHSLSHKPDGAPEGPPTRVGMDHSAARPAKSRHEFQLGKDPCTSSGEQ
jgi:hypothetical protein